MKGALLAAATVCPLAVSLAGCYWLASYKDLTTGPEDAGVTVVTPNVDAAQPGEPDSGPPSPSSFCPEDGGPFVYCMDFDGIDAGVLGLGVSEAEAGIVTDTYVSPPSSLSVSLLGPDAGEQAGAAYGVSFPFEPTVTQLQFDMRAIGLDEWVTTLGIGLADSSGTVRGLNVVLSPTGTFQVQEYFSLPGGGMSEDGHPGFDLDGGDGVGQWHHVVLQLTVNDKTQVYTSSLTVDGQVLEDAVPLGLSWAAGNASLAIGLTYAQGGGPQFFFDNVRADFQL